MDQQNEFPPLMVESVIDPALTDYSIPAGTAHVVHMPDGQPRLAVDGWSFTAAPDLREPNHPNYGHLDRPYEHYESVYTQRQHPQADTFDQPAVHLYGTYYQHYAEDPMLLDQSVQGPALLRTGTQFTYSQPAISRAPGNGIGASLYSHNTASPYHPQFAMQQAPLPSNTLVVANISGGTFNLTINGNNGVNSVSGLQQSVSDGFLPTSNGYSHHNASYANSDATVSANVSPQSTKVTRSNGAGLLASAGPSNAAQSVATSVPGRYQSSLSANAPAASSASTTTSTVPVVGTPFHYKGQDYTVLACPALRTDVDQPRVVRASFTVETPPYRVLITLAQKWAANNNLDSSRKYILDKLPDNYVVATSMRAKGTYDGKIDRYVYGVHVYRSLNELYPHLRWLAGQVPAECECKYCEWRRGAH
jgi:hypothetical protein